MVVESVGIRGNTFFKNRKKLFKNPQRVGIIQIQLQHSMAEIEQLKNLISWLPYPYFNHD